MAPTPNHRIRESELPADIPGTLVPPVFSVGDRACTFDIVAGVSRRLYCQPSEVDMGVASVAGWETRYAEDEAGHGYIELPRNARKASNVLGGMAAWNQEKGEVLTFITGYVGRLYAQHGVIDSGLSLDTVAVSRGGEEMLATPPHALVRADSEEALSWAAGMYDDISHVLHNDPQHDELMHSFAQELAFLKGQG